MNKEIQKHANILGLDTTFFPLPLDAEHAVMMTKGDEALLFQVHFTDTESVALVNFRFTLELENVIQQTGETHHFMRIRSDSDSLLAAGHIVEVEKALGRCILKTTHHFTPEAFADVSRIRLHHMHMQLHGREELKPDPQALLNGSVNFKLPITPTPLGLSLALSQLRLRFHVAARF
jgi:hypothetical protein